MGGIATTVLDVADGTSILASIASFIGVITGFTAGVFFTLALTAMFRWGARELSSATTSRRLLTVLIAQAITVICLFGIQILAFINNWPIFRTNTVQAHSAIIMSTLATSIYCFSMLSIVGSWPVVVYIVSLSLLVVHRILWPFLSRPLYAIQRHHIFENRNTLAVIGVILLIASGLPPLVFIGRDLLQTVGLK
jgi:hypothetical protein